VPPDLSHAQTEQEFHAALWGPEPPARLCTPSATEAALRFKVYRNNVHHSLTRALAARFPVIEQLVGPAFFAAMARVYITAAPPADPVLLHWGESFAPFLSQFPQVKHLPFLGDVARLEYERGRACHAADAEPLAPEALNIPDLAQLRLILHPSVALFRAQMPAAQIWLSHQPGTAPTPLRAGPDHALIAREPDFTVIVTPIDPGTFTVLTALREGETLGQAATKADPTHALTLLFRHGLIIATDKGTLE
jgi:hypothetical protein